MPVDMTVPGPALAKPASRLARLSGMRIGLARSQQPPVVAGALAVTTNVFQVFGVIAVSALVARALGPSGKGQYDLLINSALLLQTALSFSIPSGVTYVTAVGDANVRRLVLYGGGFAVAQGLVAGAVLWALAGTRLYSAIVPASLPHAQLYVAIAVCGYALYAVYRAVLIGGRRFAAANTGDVLRQVLAVSFAVLVFFLAGRAGFDLLHALIVAALASVFCTALANYHFISIAGFPRQSGSAEISSVLLYALPAYGSNAVQFLNYRLDVFVVNGYHGAREVGIYLAAVTLALGINMIPKAAQGVIIPTIAARGESEGAALSVAQASRILMTLGLLGGLVFAVAAPFALPLLFGPEFRESVAPLLLLLPGCVVFVITNVLAGYLAGLGRPNLNLLSSVCGLAVTLVLDFSLIPAFGARGAAFASTCSYATSTVVTIILFRRLSGIPLSKLFRVTGADVRHILAQGRRLLRRTTSWQAHNA